jgi:hypothetical protein
VKPVAVFQHLGHAAGRPICLVRLHHRFVFHRIERFVECVEFFNAEAIQNLCQNTFGGRNALYQSASFPCLCIGRAGVDGTAQIVEHLQQLAGKVRDRVLLGVLLAPFALTPRILGLGQRPHQPVAQRSDFGFEIGVFGFARSRPIDVIVHGVCRHVILPWSRRLAHA